MIDAEQVYREVRGWLGGHGFAPRDADPTDLQRGNDSSLRFKVGTSRGEVAIQVLVDNKLRRVLRLISGTSIEAAYTEMTNLISMYQTAPEEIR